MATKTPAPEIFLWLHPLGGDETPWPSRVKRALKALLRSYGLRARAWADKKDLPPTFQEIEPGTPLDSRRHQPPF